jgi:hypothetical protein
VSDAPTHRLSREEVQALKFAAHRQLARWAKSSQLRARRHEQRTALVERDLSGFGRNTVTSARTRQ